MEEDITLNTVGFLRPWGRRGTHAHGPETLQTTRDDFPTRACLIVRPAGLPRAPLPTIRPTRRAGAQAPTPERLSTPDRVTAPEARYREQPSQTLTPTAAVGPSDATNTARTTGRTRGTPTADRSRTGRGTIVGESRSTIPLLILRLRPLRTLRRETIRYNDNLNKRSGAIHARTQAQSIQSIRATGTTNAVSHTTICPGN